MSYCFNPRCDSPAIGGQNYCQICGAKLMLMERYRAIQLLGKGGWGKVFLSQDTQADRRCVVKQLLPPIEVQNNPASLQTFLRLFREEAVRLSELGHHPQIPTLFDYFEQELEQVGQHKQSNSKYLYMVQEYIQGENLLEELQQKGSFDEIQIRNFLRELLPVIERVHGRNVIHRDIKPENIMRRSDDNQLVLIDFGVAKKFTETNAGKPGTRVFTEGYASIEQISGRASPASDLYSLGATCLHLLTGKSPQVLEQSFQGQFWWQEALNRSQITPQLKQVLNHLLEPIAQHRYQSAHEVYQDLLPKITVSRSQLEFTFTEADLQTNPARLTQAIEIVNKTPYTSFKGEWIVPIDRMTWITISPERFSTKLKKHETKIQFDLTINPEYLMSNQVYNRSLILKTNTEPSEYELITKVQKVSPFAIVDRTLPYAPLAGVFIASVPVIPIIATLYTLIFSGVPLPDAFEISAFGWAISWAVLRVWLFPKTKLFCALDRVSLFTENRLFAAFDGLLFGTLFGIVWVVIREWITGSWYDRFASLFVAALVTKTLFWVGFRVIRQLVIWLPAIGISTGRMLRSFDQRGFRKVTAIGILLLAILAGTSWGAFWILKDQFVLSSLILAVSNSAFFLTLIWYFKPVRNLIYKRKKHQEERQNRLLIEP
ncbi:protein kinase domain-containing protein [Phormidesmis priestleyi]